MQCPPCEAEALQIQAGSPAHRQVVLAALELANALVAGDARLLEAACLLGLPPAVTRYAFAAWPLPLRAQAAAFVHVLCHASPATARMFVACQVGRPGIQPSCLRQSAPFSHVCAAS